MEISVIVAAKNHRETIAVCLASLLKQIGQTATEIIVVDASQDGTGELVAAEFPEVCLIRAEPDALVPTLWKLGFEAGQGEIIALTTAQCVPAPGWLRHLRSALQADVAGVGGPIQVPVDGAPWDWALYFSRYSAFLPPGRPGLVAEIAADNAAYKRAAIVRCRETIVDGFWEVPVHDCLSALGQKLTWEPAMMVRFVRADAPAAVVRMRFRHGKRYAATRPGNTPFTRVARALTGPLLVPLLWSRIIARTRRQRSDWLPHLWRALPALALILCAWTAGEIAGYLDFRA